VTRIGFLSALVALAGLTGCGTSVARLLVADEDVPRFNALLADPKAVRAFIADSTIKNWDDDYGTQIEYHGSDGRTWLVFPGNIRSVQGFWEIRGPAGKPSLCYRYPNSRDAITGNPGDDWECGPVALRLTDDEIVDGDVLGLAQGACALSARWSRRKVVCGDSASHPHRQAIAAVRCFHLTGCSARNLPQGFDTGGAWKI